MYKQIRTRLYGQKMIEWNAKQMRVKAVKLL